MKKLLVLILLIVLGVCAYLFFKDNTIKKSDVIVADCLNCEYEINGKKISIKDGVVYIDNKEYKDVVEIKQIDDLIVLLKEKSVIGYKDSEVFNFADGFDSSYPGMKIQTIKVDKDKMIIKTTRLVDKRTIDIGTKLPICKDGNINYGGMNERKINVTEPVTLTYDVNYDDYKPVVSYKENLADYLKELGNCIEG